MNVNGKVAIVTGGASGLGEAAVVRLANAGAKVVISDLNEEAGNQLAAKYGDNAIFVKCDVTNPDDVSAVTQAAMDKFGAVHILVNNAGVATGGRVIGKSGPAKLENFQFTVNVNLIGAFDMLAKAAWEMDKNEEENGEKGVIINVASVAAFDGQIGQAAYSASKAAVVGMTLPIARDLGRNKIRCVTVAPGIFNTPMMQQMPENVRESLGQQVPMPSRLGDPDSEFAAFVQHIVENSYLNGETIRLDGAIRMAAK
ncbi:Oxidoreductase, short-chain dehydrogenase/reductase family [Candidatus Syntrophocurvum alkaliphilum]|uniref:Oxidoreductase, short-chain dehydrogenase/reductase family n=1 Tax=Candidatus Syntrophocurvum alkaliphilum TaxID=2293317 RepID=A0A6I6D9Z0_9FIRM|nr:3-hydroxyacyl-CoA dehydrogenase [Candidatus Syntrophocurvum alkaliphilum]QGT99585.1 Oxidoreductase, short-chain dehydrogenase/reductase family [Candidatus Syntrophocurvum alkaliphilum]